MFNKDKNNESTLITSLKNRIQELEQQIIQFANDNGSIIVKQLPNGTIELNGIEIDNTTEVEYYNSSQATYGELTMFRIGKEAKQREMNKLIACHMDEIDKFNQKISNLHQDILILENKLKIDANTITMYEKSENDLKLEIENLKTQNINDKEIANVEKQELINRYEGMIAGLEDDIKSWKERYLKINNITPNGTIITKYGKILGS